MNKAENRKGIDWLGFCDISAPMMTMISKEQQFAEKIHAYTLPRDGRLNSRVKDLVDLVLLFGMGDFDRAVCREALHIIFRVRGTHQLPTRLLPPPVQWEDFFKKMAIECGIESDLTEAYEKINQFFQEVVQGVEKES